MQKPPKIKPLHKLIKLPRIKPLDKLILGEIQKEKRIPIPSAIKKRVYDKANRKCECCGMRLKMNQGEFHHLNKPTVKPKPSKLQFLCPTHHKLGHERKTRTVRTMLETRKVPYIKRKRVRKHPSSPYWKEKPKKSLSRKKKTKPKTTKTQRRRRKKR